jgi:phosphoribosylanthranilate isomerase
LHPVVRVKICGLTRVDEALACAHAGADWIGLNLYPGSPRFVPEAKAASIVAALPPSVAAVGIFVDRPAAEIAEVAERLGLAIVQLHGREPPEVLHELGHLRVVRTFRLRQTDCWAEVNGYLDRAKALGRLPDAVLIDTYRPGTVGGTGEAIEDRILDGIPSLPRLILAGGLTAQNVAAKVARVRPWMVDVASGVENAPGRKDLDLVVAFVRAARSVPYGDPDSTDRKDR